MLICAIIERIAVNRSFIKSLNGGSGNQAREACDYRPLCDPAKRDFINNKINLLSISAEYRMIAVIVMRLTDATGAQTRKTGFPA
jgi:hypothetical protein